MTDPMLVAAVRNNARWCELVCRTHGTPGVFADDAWSSPRRTPVFYPDAVTLTPAASASAVLARIDTTTAGASIKDSFANLNPGTGFRVLFDAWWILHSSRDRAARLASVSSVTGWRRVRDSRGLAGWARAWGDVPDLFRPALLDDPRVAVLAALNGDTVAAGAIAFASDGVAAVTNLFDVAGDLDVAWRAAVRATAEAFPGQPIVGYEHGDELAAARPAGFHEIGPLRVWSAISR